MTLTKIMDRIESARERLQSNSEASRQFQVCGISCRVSQDGWRGPGVHFEHWSLSWQGCTFDELAAYIHRFQF